MAKVLFVVTEDWYFWSHRLSVAQAAREQGWEVVVATHVQDHREAIVEQGFELVEVPFERSLRHPFKDLLALFYLIATFRRKQAEIVHLVALKPILLGSLAAFFAPRSNYIGAFAGLGYLFVGEARLARSLRRLVAFVLRHCFAGRRHWSIVQNDNDRQLLQSEGLIDAPRATLIPGAGVDLERFSAAPLPGVPTVLLPARMLADKGVREFVEAAAVVKLKFPQARFVLVGPLDPDNPAAISRAQLQQWQVDGAIEWWGASNDMPGVYRQATIVCLPSYREGLPKVLLEAAAMGRPLVACDVPGCREICIHEETGLLVAAKNPQALAAAIARLLNTPERAVELGGAARALAELKFDHRLIGAQTLAFYTEILGCSQ